MKHSWQRFTIVLVGITLVAVMPRLGWGQVLIPHDSTWKWWHSSEGVDPAEEVEDFHSTFFKADFDDSEWKEGKDKPGPDGGFGYGNEGFEGVDIGPPEDPEDRKTAYLRLRFKTTEPHDALLLKCQLDDGMIVYLNGEEVLRENVGDGDEAHDLFAEQTIAGDDETEVKTFPLEDVLPLGEHLLAISVHNRKGGSSDLRIAEISLSVADEDDLDDEEDSEDEDDDGDDAFNFD